MAPNPKRKAAFGVVSNLNSSRIGVRMTDKTIAQKSRKGAISILLVLLLGGLLAGYGFNDVRMGGPLHHRNQQVSDFIADIIPPPEYVLEAYLEVSLLHNKPALLSENVCVWANWSDPFGKERAIGHPRTSTPI
jgi:hypothetical protein